MTAEPIWVIDINSIPQRAETKADAIVPAESQIDLATWHGGWLRAYAGQLTECCATRQLGDVHQQMQRS